MACMILLNLFPLLIFQWLPLAEASHFRHGMIMWAPADSYSNTVRADYFFNAASSLTAFRKSFSIVVVVGVFYHAHGCGSNVCGVLIT